MRKIKNIVLLSLITVVCLFGLSAVSACTEPVDGYTIMNNYIIQPTLRYELYTLYASNAEVNGFTFSTDKSECIVAVGDSFKKVNITNGNGILKISYDDTEIIVDDALCVKTRIMNILRTFGTNEKSNMNGKNNVFRLLLRQINCLFSPRGFAA